MHRPEHTCCDCIDKNSNSTSNKSHEKPKRQISPLLLVAATFGVGAACLNTWIGSPYSFATEKGYENMTAMEEAAFSARLQLSITKESILRPEGDQLYFSMLSMASLREHQHRDTEAIHWLKKAASFREFNLSPTDPSLFQLCGLYLRHGRIDDAYKLVQSWEKRSMMDKNTLSNELVPFYLLRAKVFKLANKPEEEKEANRLAEKCMSLPRHLYMREGEAGNTASSTQSDLFYWGCNQMALGNYAAARRIMHELVQGLPDVPADKNIRSDAIYMTSVIDSCAGNFEDAEKSFAVAAQLPVDETSNARTAFCHHYVRFLRSKGRHAEAATYEAEELTNRKYEFGALWPK